MIFTIDSKITITTSRKPSQKTRRFAQFLKHYLNAAYINRGKTSINKIVTRSKNENADRLLLITETKGNPSSINVYDVDADPGEALYSIYINVSMPQHKKNINADNPITIVSTVKTANELNELFTPAPKMKIKRNCIILTEDDKKDDMLKAAFYDKEGLDTEYKIYIKGFDFSKQIFSCD